MIKRDLSDKVKSQLSEYLNGNFEIVKIQVDPTETDLFNLTIFGPSLDKVVDAAKFLERQLHDYIRNDFPDCWE